MEECNLCHKVMVHDLKINIEVGKFFLNYV